MTADARETGIAGVLLEVRNEHARQRSRLSPDDCRELRRRAVQLAAAAVALADTGDRELRRRAVQLAAAAVALAEKLDH